MFILIIKTAKIQEAEVQLNNKGHYQPLEQPMVTETLQRAENEIATQLQKGKHMGDMTIHELLIGKEYQLSTLS